MGRNRKEVILPDGWEEKIHEIMSVGGTIAEVLVELGLNRRDHATLKSANEEYKNAIDDGVLAAEAWWSKLGRTDALGKTFNHVSWIFTMKARFGWREAANQEPPKKPQHEGDDDLIKKYKAKEDKKKNEKDVEAVN